MPSPLYEAYIERLAGHIRDTFSDDSDVAYRACLAVNTASSQEVEAAMEYNYSHPQPAKVCGNRFCANDREYPSTYSSCPYCDEALEVIMSEVEANA